jgi:ferritin
MKKPVKLPSEVVNLLLPRLTDEFNAAYFYRAASNWCNNVGFFKAGTFFAAESEDEFGHAKKIEQFLVDWNVTPELPSIPKPTLTFSNLTEVITKAYEMEYDLYEAYEDTSSKIFKTGDLCVFDFLQQYRTGQTKAVAEYSDKLNVLEGVNLGSKFEMLMLEENLFG